MTGDREYRLRLRIDELRDERDKLERDLAKMRKRRDYYKAQMFALRQRRDDLKQRLREFSFELQGHRAREARRERFRGRRLASDYPATKKSRKVIAA